MPTRLARARCERLLRACPPVLEISANSSLDGEVGDDSAEVAGSGRVWGAHARAHRFDDEISPVEIGLSISAEVEVGPRRQLQARVGREVGDLRLINC